MSQRIGLGSIGLGGIGLGLIGVALLLFVGGCCCGEPAAPVCGDVYDGERDDGDEGNEVRIAVDQVPANVKAAALAAVPGLVIEEAVRESAGGRVIYDIEGTANGKEFELEVTAGGQVLDVEADEDGEDHEDGDDEDDDDDA